MIKYDTADLPRQLDLGPEVELEVNIEDALDYYRKMGLDPVKAVAVMIQDDRLLMVFGLTGERGRNVRRLALLPDDYSWQIGAWYKRRVQLKGQRHQGFWDMIAAET